VKFGVHKYESWGFACKLHYFMSTRLKLHYFMTKTACLPDPAAASHFLDLRSACCVCVIGFINTFDSQSHYTNDSPRKYVPVHSTKRNGYKCVCVCVPSLLLLPLSKVLVSSDTTAGRSGAGASITGDGVI
jgi:hypothetical protein